MDTQTTNKSQWSFNETTAQIFQTHALQHIPDYDKVIGFSIEITLRLFGIQARVLDFGSALGHTVDRFYQAGIDTIIGIEKSNEMCSHSMHQDKIIVDDKIPNDIGLFDVIVANWTLHFIPERDITIRSFIEYLSEEGCIIITDKIASSEYVHELYMDFKRRNGLTEEEIIKKTESLRGVLMSYSLGFYTSLFQDLGLEFDIINATPCFITFALRKSKKL